MCRERERGEPTGFHIRRLADLDDRIVAGYADVTGGTVLDSGLHLNRLIGCRDPITRRRERAGKTYPSPEIDG